MASISIPQIIATPKDKVDEAVRGIRQELDERVAWFESHNGYRSATHTNANGVRYELLEEMGFVRALKIIPVTSLVERQVNAFACLIFLMRRV